MVRVRGAALVAWSVIVTMLPFAAAVAEEGIPAGSGAVITAAAPVLVRATPGWDAAVASELAMGSAVTVWDGAQAAPDGSLWYPVDGGFVPVDALTSVSSLTGGVTLSQDTAPGAATGESIAPAPPDPAGADLAAPDQEQGAAPTDAWVDPATGEAGGAVPDHAAVEPLAVGVAVEPAPSVASVDLEQDAGKRNGASGKAIVEFAMRYAGHPYVNGGEGPKAFDCSGFTMFVMHKTLGLDISHDLEVQYKMGSPVNRKGLQPGDLVFFKNTDRRGLSHTGIYLGGGQFIHAENEATGVTVSELDAEYYRSRWYGAVRFA
jgi:cell wall-associated NlpC family hydrolase